MVVSNSKETSGSMTASTSIVPVRTVTGGHDEPRRAEGKEDKDQLSSSLGTPGQEKGEQLFPSSPTAVPKGRLETLPWAVEKGTSVGLRGTS